MTGTTMIPGPQLPPLLQEAIDKFEAWGGQHLSVEQNASTISLPLYHYTNAQGLRGILESGRVWFTDYRHLNDPSELTHGIKVAHDVARSLCEDADERVRLFLENFIHMLRADNFTGNLEFFIASFSRKRDDLNQWRAYADNGKGYAIGFAPEMFAITDQVPGKPGEVLGPVRYKIEEVRARHDVALKKAVTIFLDTAEANADLVGDNAVSFMDAFVRVMMAQPIIWNCLTSKHHAYEHEEEVRLLIMGTLERLSPHVTTRPRGSEIVPYIPHQMPLREPRYITEIVVGPAASPGTERAVRTLLASLGLDPNIVVSQSDIPYRAL